MREAADPTVLPCFAALSGHDLVGAGTHDSRINSVGSMRLSKEHLAAPVEVAVAEP